MKLINSLIILFVIFTFETLFASEKNIGRVCTLTAGYDEVKPFHFKNSKNVVVGIDADILRKVMKQINCNVVFRELPWGRTLLSVKNGAIDIGIGAGFKIQRAQWAYYSVSYKYIDHWLYTKAKQHQKVDSIEKFFEKKLRLGVVVGWGYPTEIRRSLDSPKNLKLINQVSTFKQLPKMLNLGRLDGIIAIPSALKGEIIRNKISSQFVSRAQYKEELYIIFSKKSVSPQLVTDFNNALYAFISSGQRKEVLSKY